MNSVWRELRFGWTQARWIGLFTLYLTPMLAAVLLVSQWLPGGWKAVPGSAPGPAAVALVVLATLVSLFFTARADGPTGFVGKPFYGALLLLIVAVLIRRIIAGEERPSLTLKLDDVSLELSLVATPIDEEPAREGWRNLQVRYRVLQPSA